MVKIKDNMQMRSGRFLFFINFISRFDMLFGRISFGVLFGRISFSFRCFFNIVGCLCFLPNDDEVNDQSNNNEDPKKKLRLVKLNARLTVLQLR